MIRRAITYKEAKERSQDQSWLLSKFVEIIFYSIIAQQATIPCLKGIVF
jgi:hypothetical protein